MNFPRQNLKRILFLDIETATAVPNYSELNEELKEFWKIRYQRQVHIQDNITDDELASYFENKAAIFAEYAKIVCISVGFLTSDKEDAEFRVKSFFGDDERQILIDFSDLLGAHFYDPFSCFICGHNIKEFDIPFLCRRYIVNNLPLPIIMNITGHKPWQIHHLLDTLELWKFGDYKHYSSLDLLCNILSIESPKNEMSGKDVSRKYWDGHIEEITHYCERDVVATARVYLRCIGANIFSDEKIVFAPRN